jgi:hypothetical protein
LKRRPHFKTHKSLGKKENMVMGPTGPETVLARISGDLTDRPKSVAVED